MRHVRCGGLLERGLADLSAEDIVATVAADGLAGRILSHRPSPWCPSETAGRQASPETAAAPKTHDQPAAPKNPKDQHVRKY
jgi:hypothetical protein